MQKALIALLLVSLGGLFMTQGDLSLSSSFDLNGESSMYKQFLSWQKEHNIFYADQAESMYRFGVFRENLQLIAKINSQEGKEVLAANVMAQYTNEEYQQRFLNAAKMTASNAPNQKTFQRDPNFQAKSEVNWVKAGAVAPVQNQGSCGSCWAFGSVGGLEGANFLKTGTLTKFSEQQLVDCNLSNFGCSGGDELQAYAYTKTQGIMTEESYPYVSGNTGRRQECKYNENDVVFYNTGSFKVTVNDPEAIVEAVTKQPLSKGIAASSIYFQLYNGNTVMDNTGCGTRIDHSVTLVGYSDNDPNFDTPYWVIKNSWGTGWGAKGYMRVAKDNKHDMGICAINNDSTGPTWN